MTVELFDKRYIHLHDYISTMLFCERKWHLIDKIKFLAFDFDVAQGINILE